MLRPLATLLTIALLAGCSQGAVAGPAAARAPQALAARSAEEPAAPAALLGLPRFVRTADGRTTEPINVVVAGTEAEVVGALAQAGWLPADALTFKTALRILKSALTGKDYPTAPISQQHLFGRVQDLAYQKNADGVKSRDHFRAWKTPLQDALGRPYWAIGASRDATWGVHKLKPIHHIDPDLDTERDMLASDLVKTGLVTGRSAYRAFEPGFRSRNGEGDPFYTNDGRVVVLDLKTNAAP